MPTVRRWLLVIVRSVIGTSSEGVIKRIVLLAILALIYACIVTIIGVLYGTYYSIASIDLADGYTLKLWNENPGILGDWDPDIPYPSIYYQIERKGNIAVPTTSLGLDFHYTYDIKVVFAEHNQLACVYDTKLWTKGLYVIWDKSSGESWPRLRDDEVSYRPLVQQKWQNRYTRLKLENPTLPTIWSSP
jgi:hypothetical protein